MGYLFVLRSGPPPSLVHASSPAHHALPLLPLVLHSQASRHPPWRWRAWPPRLVSSRLRRLGLKSLAHHHNHGHGTISGPSPPPSTSAACPSSSHRCRRRRLQFPPSLPPPPLLARGLGMASRGGRSGKLLPDFQLSPPPSSLREG
jgi:hypothetical protein